MLKKDYKGLIKEKSLISNYVELSELAKFLMPAKKSYSLANVVEMILSIL